jgi:hypothetical protein
MLDNGVGPIKPYLEIARFGDSAFLDVAFYWGALPAAIGLPVPRLGDYSIDTYHLLVLTYDAVTGTLIGRVDDGCMSSAAVWVGPNTPAYKLQAQVSAGALAAANASTFSRLQLLQKINGNYVNFEGALDDLRIWTRVLTDAEIADIWYRSDEEIPVYSFGEAGTETITVTATDATGCTASDTVDVTVGAEFSVSVVAVYDAESGADGEAIVTFTYTIVGGTAPYTYLLEWTGGGDAGPDTQASPVVITFTGTPQASEAIPWSLTVTDDNLDEASDSGSVDVVYQD